MSKNFEAKIKKAKETLDNLMSDNIDLDKALKLYKDGMINLNDAQSMLDDAKLEFASLIKKYDSSHKNG